MFKVFFILVNVIRHVFSAVDVYVDGMNEAGYRYEYFFGNRIVFSRFIAIESQVIPMSQKGMVSGIVVPDIRQIGRDRIRFVGPVSFGHLQRVGDVAVVRDTSVFSHLQVFINKAEMHVVLVAVIVGKEITVEQCRRLAVVFSSSVGVVNVESES